MSPYGDSLEHLQDEMARLDLLLKRALLLAPPPGTDAPRELRGLVIGDDEAHRLAASPRLWGEEWLRQETLADVLTPLDRSIDEERRRIDDRRRVSVEAGVFLSLPALAERLELSQAEVDVLLLALAPELESRYETLIAYLHDDVTRRRPSVGLALRLLSRSEPERVRARSFLAPDAPLLRHEVIHLAAEGGDAQPSSLRRVLVLDPSVVEFLLAESRPRLPPVDAAAALASVPLEASTRDALVHLAAWLRAAPRTAALVHLVGRRPERLDEVARSLCAALGRPLETLEPSRGDGGSLRGAIRDARLADAALAVPWPARGAEEPAAAERNALEGIFAQLDGWQGPVLLLAPPTALPAVPPEWAMFRVEIPEPDFALRREAWSAILGSEADGTATRLADSFRFGTREIRRTVSLASGLARLRAVGDGAATQGDLLEAGRVLATPSLDRLALHVEPRHDWDDIVLPSDRLDQLRRVAVRMKRRHRVHHEWGFGRKLSRGRGLNVLFAGPSGTGKTLAAEVLAADLGLDLFQIDLSSVVSKYIGETEKNLSALFDEAETARALLFFDEADALFGKRTEIKDAHDRYANIEVNYLLQRIEQFEGMVVLATNLQRNLDDAFLRRMHEVVEFPFPDDSLRERIWRGHFPEEAPRADDIDFAFLSRQFKLTGGSIKNAVLNAAFLAAQDGGTISMSHLILSVKAEIQKQGRLCVKADFGRYYDVVHAKG